MKKKDELKLPPELGYTAEHIWLRREPDGTAVLGVSDFAQDQLGEVLYVDLPEPGTHFNAGDELGSVESVKSVNALYMPEAGEILERNVVLDDEPTAVNRDCYGSGWMLKIRPDGAAGKLLDAAAYKATLK